MRNALATAVVLLAMTTGSTTSLQAQELELFVAELHGGNEVPPVATGAFGWAWLTLDQNLGRVDCKVTVYNSPPVSAAHISRRQSWRQRPGRDPPRSAVPYW